MKHRIGYVTVALAAMAFTGAVPANAHGALSAPLSRAAACGADGPREAARSAACRAAVRAGGGALPGEWDNLRVADVAGRDRAVIPDGRLCSGGLPAFKGLDLARSDWPASTLRAGARYTFKYRGTIPHRGTFRLYVTRKGYDPAKPLKWSDLERRPFLQVTDPAMKNGSYSFSGRLPGGRTGRHLIYTIWQNSDTPDTYYSCSDVIFRRPTAPVAAAAAVPAPSAARGDLSWLVGGSTALAGAAGATGLLIARRRRHR